MTALKRSLNSALMQDVGIEAVLTDLDMDRQGRITRVWEDSKERRWTVLHRAEKRYGTALKAF